MRLPNFKRRRLCGLAALAPLLPLAPGGLAHGASAAEPPASENDEARTLLLRSDEIRFPRESFQTEILVRNFSSGEPGDERKFRVLSRGNENTIVQTLEPVSERGQILLMRGRDLWVFLPAVSQPVRLSLSQRLTGQVANGDLARANFAGDYSPVIAGTDTVDNQAAYVLDLTAVDRGVTYAKVRYWVRQDDARPMRAEFFALSGRLLKTCLYEDFKDMAGRMRPTRLVMEDALKRGEISVLTYESMTIRDLPERMFTREYLRRIN